MCCTQRKRRRNNDARAGKLDLQKSGGGVMVIGTLIVLAVCDWHSFLPWAFFPRVEQSKEIEASAPGDRRCSACLFQVINAEPAANKESVCIARKYWCHSVHKLFYARIDGYLKSRLVDIGDHVKKGSNCSLRSKTPTVDEKVSPGSGRFCWKRKQTLADQ